MISQSRWDEIIEEVESCLVDRWYAHSITKEGLSLIMSVLKNNTPFQVVPDCCLGNNKQQVSKPNKETIEAMNENESQEILSTNVLLETEHFKVLGDKE